jgi:hypothetical protein
LKDDWIEDYKIVDKIKEVKEGERVMSKQDIKKTEDKIKGAWYWVRIKEDWFPAKWDGKLWDCWEDLFTKVEEHQMMVLPEMDKIKLIFHWFDLLSQEEKTKVLHKMLDIANARHMLATEKLGSKTSVLELLTFLHNEIGEG